MYIAASELNDPICHSDECQIGSFSSEATIWIVCQEISIYISIKTPTIMYSLYKWHSVSRGWGDLVFLSDYELIFISTVTPCCRRPRVVVAWRLSPEEALPGPAWVRRWRSSVKTWRSVCPPDWSCPLLWTCLTSLELVPMPPQWAQDMATRRQEASPAALRKASQVN